MELCCVPGPSLKTLGMCKKVVQGPGLIVPGQPNWDVEVLFGARWTAIREGRESAAKKGYMF